jgi:2,3-bisphosphoglycerate-dependent phosphoglycerate mutase
MTHLYLIRHGEAFANVQPIMGGMKGDAGLTPLGVAQAEALRDRLAESHEIAADVLIASPLPRARQTAEIIAPALGLAIINDDDVQEILLGEADGMHVGDYRAKFGLPDFRHEPFRAIAPGGEFWGQFVLRTAVTLDRITREHAGKTIVVVCHGGIIDSSFLIFFGLSSLTIPPVELHTHNTSITHWERIEREDSSTRWKLLGYNDDTHLRLVGRNDHIMWRDIPPAGEAQQGEDRPSVPLTMESET